MVDKKGSFNIWKIIKGDFDKIRNNTIAWIVDNRADHRAIALRMV